MKARGARSKGNAADPLMDQLQSLGVTGVLRKMVESQQIVELRCEMPKCLKGAESRDPLPDLHFRL